MFTFFAKTNKSFIPSLQAELKILGINNSKYLQKERLNYVKFESDQLTVWKAMLHSRLIEGLKIQIASNIHAKSERDLKINFKKIKLDNFLPIANSVEFKIPQVKAYCFRSNLFHEKMVENIVKTTLNKMAFTIKQDKEQNINSEIKSKNKYQEKRNKKVEKNKEDQKEEDPKKIEDSLKNKVNCKTFN